MKTTKVLIGLVLAVTLAAGLLGSPGKGRAQPAPEPHYYCHIAPGGDPEILVDLETQFGPELGVDVGPGELLCLPAIKTRAGRPPEGTLLAPHTRTFYIDENLPEPIYVNLETQFGYYENVLVQHASSLILPVSKEVTYPIYQPPTDLAAEPHYKCYDIFAPGPYEEVLVETQFFPPPGIPVIVGDAVRLCLPAGKNGEPIPAVPHGVCYAAWVPGPFALVNLQTQFAFDIDPPFWEEGITVFDGVVLCVPAIKEEVGPPVADKGVLDIEFDDATDSYPDPGPVIPDNRMDIDASLDGSQQYIVSVTSQDYLYDGEPPDDSWVGFYADIPAGCYGYWLPDDPLRDTRTRYGDPFAYPATIPDPAQIGQVADWADGKETGDDPSYSAGGQFEADIHFQTLAYGLYEELGIPLPLTRYFEFHCVEPSEHIFTFCNKIEPKPPWEDPDIVDAGRWPTYPGQPGDNVLCEDLAVEVWAEVDIQAGVAGFGDGDIYDDDCSSAPPASIPANQDVDLCLVKYVTHPGPDYVTNPGVDLLITPPVGCTLPVDPSGSYWVSGVPQGAWAVTFGVFTINCSQAGNKTFTIDDTWDLDRPEDEHITDPDTTNNDGQFDWSVDVEGPQEPHYYCYWAPGYDPDIAVHLETQFGPEDVDVGQGDLLCAPAEKTRAGQPPEGTMDGTHLRMFDLWNANPGAPPPGRVVNLETQFGYYENVEVGRPFELAMPVSKEVVDPPTGEVTPLEAEPHYKCYSIWDADLPPVNETVQVETQFGVEEVLVQQPYLLCLPAEKNFEPVTQDAPHQVCYVADAPSVNWVVNLYTQFAAPPFDFWEEFIDVYSGDFLCVPAIKEVVEQRPTFSIEFTGPSSTIMGGLYHPADILHNPAAGGPAICIPCAGLGLAPTGGCVNVPPSFDDLDALSYGADFGPYSSQEGYLGFSVDHGSSGQPGTAVNVEATCPWPEPDADEFITPLDGSNTQYFDGDGASCGGNAGAPIGLVEIPPPEGGPTDDLDALDNKDCSEIDPDGDGLPDRWVYFSLHSGAATLLANGWGGADVLVTTGGMMPNRYALAWELGLVGPPVLPEDDVDGLCLADTGMDDIFDPDGSLTGFQDYLFYTVTSSSPSIGGLVPNAATIMYVVSPGVAIPVDTATALGLLEDNTDDVDAMKCVKGLVDISIDDYYITLPDGTETRPGDPIASVWLTVSEWTDFGMFELKHYYGVEEELSPPSVTSQVGWAVLPPVLPIPLNVRFNALPGDICTDIVGAPVPCGEGGVAGVPWDPDSLLFPPPPGIDSCKDGIDNDDDVTFDHPVNNPVNPDPDCVDIYDVHFEIGLDWSVDVGVGREVQIHCEEAGEFQVTFENIELPLGADDIEPGNNTGYIDVTIICEEEVLIADKMVENVWLDDGSGYPFPSPFSAPASVPVYEQHVISITSEDLNLGPEVPEDALVAFYADIPPGCYGRWYDDHGAFPSDTYTVGGDPFADPFSPEQLGAVDPAPLTKKTDDPAGLSPFEIDLHFQMAEYYGYFAEEVGPATPITRFFGFHCEEPSTHTFFFCNKIEPKPPYEDPNFPWNHGPWPGNNVACVQYDVDVIAQVDLVIQEMSLTPPSPYTVEPSEEKQITLDETVYNIGFYGPVDALITKELDVPAGCWGDIEGDSAGGGGTAVHTETVPDMDVGVPVHMSETITVRCDATGTYHFTLRKQIEPVDPHVIDTDPEPPRVEDIEVIVEAAAQDPSLSLHRNSPTLFLIPPAPPFIVPANEGDILDANAPAPPVDSIGCGPMGVGLGLPFCMGPGTDELNSLSYGVDFTLPPPDGVHWLFFSVAPGSAGAAGSAVAGEASCIGQLPNNGAEPEADVFGTKALGSNIQNLDGDGVACNGNAAPSVGLQEQPIGGSDDLDALDEMPVSFVDWDGDGWPDAPIYFTLDNTSPSVPALMPGPGGPPSPDDVFVCDPNWGCPMFPPMVYADGVTQLGLMPGDEIDALCVLEDGDGEYFPPMGDMIVFSLSPASPSVLAGMFSAADVLTPGGPAGPIVIAGAQQIGLMTTDDLNALKCFEEQLFPDLDGDTIPDQWEAQQTACGPLGPGDWDGDTLTDAQEYGLSTDPCKVDTDGDGCADGPTEETGANPATGGTRNPLDFYDFYDVLVPTVFWGPGGVRDQAVSILNDVLAVLEYTGTSNNGPPNGAGRDYDQDNDMNAVKDGVEYDRSVSLTGPWSGPPDGAITILTDVLLVLAQSGAICTAPPN